MSSVGQIVAMSLKDYWHEKLLSLCAILGLAAVLAPLLVLLGIKVGIVSTMVDRLVRDPANLEVIPEGSGRYDSAWFERAATFPGVGFLVPQTRAIASDLALYHPGDTARRTEVASLIPTGQGDPVMVRWGAVDHEQHHDAHQIVITDRVADKLDLQAGDTVMGRVGRARSGVPEDAEVELTVLAVLPPEASQRSAAYVLLPLLTATEDYRDGYGSDLFGWPGDERPQGDRIFPSFRLYAETIYDVAPLSELLRAEHIEVYTRAAEIETVKRIDTAFTLIFQLILLVAVAGYFASMASSILAQVKRKSRHLGTARLIGFSSTSVLWFPVAQALATSLLGAFTALALYLVVARVINTLFAPYLAEGEYVCQLHVSHLGLVLGLTLAMGVLASVFAAHRATRIEPSEVIRDV